MNVQRNGAASGTIVGSGGTESVSGGGTDFGTTIDSGGSEVVLALGTATSTTISGGIEIVNFGGTAAGIVIGRGGTAAIMQGAIISGPITFATSVGTLEIGGNSPALPPGTISGLAIGDTIDLTDAGFVSGGTAFVSGGFLKVTENGSSYALGLSNPASLSGDRFVLSGDGGSGTDVTLSAALLFVSSSSYTQTSADLKAGGTVALTLDMSEHPVTVSGTPKLALNDSGFAVYVASASKPASGTLVFKYTVSSGQNTADLQVTGVTSGGWSVTSGGHQADLDGAIQDLGLTVDTNTPKIVSASATPTSGGTAHLGQTVTIDLDLSDAPLVVTGTPTLKLSDGGTATYVASASHQTSGVLQFDYTVTSGQSASNLKITSASLNGGSIKDLAGNTATLSLTTAQANLNVTVDGIAPTVTSVTAAASSNNVLSGGDIIIALKMSQPVTVTGSPVLTLNDGGTASYVIGSTTNLLIFKYAVGAESTADLKIIGIDQTSGTITDTAGNELSVTLSSNLNLAINADSWKVGSSGNFTTSADWTLGAPPTSSQEASISHAGTYTVSSTVDATVAALDIGDKTATLAITSGSTFSVTSGTGVDASLGTIVVQNGATLDIGGTFANSGTLFASGAGSTVDITGVVRGGTAEVGNGVVDIQGASSENVTFRSGGTGGFQLGVSSAYSGKVSGFGGDISQFIDFTDINSAGATLSYTPNASHPTSGGVLTVSSGGTAVATIDMVGKYVTSNFTLGHDNGGHLEITDPPGIGFGATTTLAFSEDNSRTGGTLTVTEGTHAAAIALLGNYMASTLVTGADGHGGTLVTEAPQPGQPPPLAHPHA